MMMLAESTELWMRLARAAPFAAVLALFVTAIAVLRSPRAKLLLFSMPVPFTCAYLASNLPVNATHVTALGLTVGYHWLVLAGRRWLPLPVAIAVGVSVFMVGASSLRGVADWSPVWVFMGMWVGWAWFAWRFVPRPQQAVRQVAPWWIKLPTVFALACAILLLRDLLAGAVTAFPYAGVFVSYEMRGDLRYLAGQFTINMLGMATMVVTMWMCLQLGLPHPWELIPGWITLLVVLGALHRAGLAQVTAVAQRDA